MDQPQQNESNDQTNIEEQLNQLYQQQQAEIEQLKQALATYADKKAIQLGDQLAGMPAHVIQKALQNTRTYQQMGLVDRYRLDAPLLRQATLEQVRRDTEADKKLINGMIIFACIAAILIPVSMFFNVFGEYKPHDNSGSGATAQSSSRDCEYTEWLECR